MSKKRTSRRQRTQILRRERDAWKLATFPVYVLLSCVTVYIRWGRKHYVTYFVKGNTRGRARVLWNQNRLFLGDRWYETYPRCMRSMPRAMHRYTKTHGCVGTRRRHVSTSDNRMERHEWGYGIGWKAKLCIPQSGRIFPWESIVELLCVTSRTARFDDSWQDYSHRTRRFARIAKNGFNEELYNDIALTDIII